MLGGSTKSHASALYSPRHPLWQSLVVGDGRLVQFMLTVDEKTHGAETHSTKTPDNGHEILDTRSIQS